MYCNDVYDFVILVVFGPSFLSRIIVNNATFDVSVDEYHNYKVYAFFCFVHFFCLMRIYMMKFMSPFHPINGMVDSKNNLHCENLFYAQIDVGYSTLSGLGYGKFKVRASETK